MKKIHSIGFRFDDFIHCINKIIQDVEKVDKIRDIFIEAFVYGHNENTRLWLYPEKDIDIQFIEKENFK